MSEHDSDKLLGHRERVAGASDLFKFSWVRSAELSPDATNIVCGLSYVEPATDEERFRLVTVPVHRGDPTTWVDDVTNPWPSWSPDGEYLAYLASDNRSVPQVWIMPRPGGPPTQLTALAQGVVGPPRWSPDGKRIAFTAKPGPAQERATPRRITRLTYRFDGLGYLDDPLEQVFIVEVRNAVIHQLTADRLMNSDPKWSPDGAKIMYLSSFPADEDWDQEAALNVVDVETHEIANLIDRWGGVISAEWLPSSDAVAFLGWPHGDPWLNRFDVWVVPIGSRAEPACRTVSTSHDFRSRLQFDTPSFNDSLLKITEDGRFAYAGSQRGGIIEILKVALEGEERIETVVSGERSCWLLDVKRDSVLFCVSDLNRPNELYVAGGNGQSERRITQLNDGVIANLARPEIEHLDVASGDGLHLEAWLMKPMQGRAPYPTILYLHGGPHAAVGHAYSFDFQLLAGAGYAVLFPNYRGSAGYGLAFMRALEPDQGPRGFPDHMAALDHAIDTGLADPDRLGIYGISAGGFQAAWAIGHTSRFKAAVLEDAVTSLPLRYGIADIVASRVSALGGALYEMPDVYRAYSPITFAHRCRTPTLLIVCEDDLRCNPPHSEFFYRVLRSVGCAAEMLRLPNASHVGSWSGPPAGRRAQNEALVDWYGRYLAVDVS